MKILITNAYAKGSGGDMAILDSLISEMRRVFNNPQITVATIDDPDNIRQVFPGTKCVPSLITTIWKEDGSRVIKFISLFKNWLGAKLWCLIFRHSGKKADFLLKKSEKEAIHAISEADLVVGVGGGYIRENSGFLKIIDLALTLRMLNLGCTIKKTSMLYSQSVGPFGNKVQQRMAASLLKKMKLIITRESISLNLLKDMGIPSEHLLESTDAAFLTRERNGSQLVALPEEIAVMKSEGRPIVGVTARNWLKGKKQKKYEAEMALALDEIGEKYSARIVFIPQTTVTRHQDDDRIVQKRIFKHMKRKDLAVCLEEPYGHHMLLDIYGSLDYLIGTRFHSAIFAMTAYVPSLVIAYEHKAAGIMKDLDLSEWVIDIEKVNASALTENFSRLWEERESYIKQLELKLPDYIKRAELAGNTIKEAYISSEQSNQLLAEKYDEAKSHKSLSGQKSPSYAESAVLRHQDIEKTDSEN